MDWCDDVLRGTSRGDKPLYTNYDKLGTNAFRIIVAGCIHAMQLSVDEAKSQHLCHHDAAHRQHRPPCQRPHLPDIKASGLWHAT